MIVRLDQCDLPASDRVFRYVPYERLDAYCALGWLPCPRMMATHHGFYSVICEFVCCCGRDVEEPGKRNVPHPASGHLLPQDGRRDAREVRA